VPVRPVKAAGPGAREPHRPRHIKADGGWRGRVLTWSAVAAVRYARGHRAGRADRRLGGGRLRERELGCAPALGRRSARQSERKALEGFDRPSAGHFSASPPPDASWSPGSWTDRVERAAME
jgi:hypothetical protein